MRVLAGFAAIAAAALLLGSGAAGKLRPAVAKAGAVATGGLHTCALTSRGGVECWGWNGHGELGDGTTVDQSAPVAVSGLSGEVRAVAAGGSDETYEGSHTCALTRAGGVECWGWNKYGQLGDGTRTDRQTPVPVRGLSRGVRVIAAGGESIYRGGFSCAVTNRGGARCWGANQSGQLGDGTRRLRTKPVPVHGISALTIAAGGSHACAVTRARRVLCWGNNEYGQLGDGTTRTRTRPVPVRGIGHGVLALALEGQSSCALTTARGVKCWGYNSEGELGDGTTTDQRHPVDVVGLSRGVRQIAGGDNHACALTSGGAVKCWGFNPWGQLGIGTTAQRHRPTPVRGLAKGASAVAAGSSTTCALVRAGAVKCWGYNKFGQVGDGTKTARLQPAGVIGFGSVPCLVPDVRGLPLADAKRAIAGGRCHTGLVDFAASSRVGTGLVISQSPKPGARLERGGDVHLVVSGSPPGINFSPGRGWVVAGLSADGHRVAIHVVHAGNDTKCHRLLIWRGAGAPAAINAGCTEENDRSVTDFALAGQRVAWVDYEYGNHAYCSVLTATAARPHAVDTGYCPGEGGVFVGHFAGDGSLLVFNSWGNGSAVIVLSGPSIRRGFKSNGKVVSVAGGRIGVRGPDGSILVQTATGNFVRHIRVKAKTAKLDGSTLVVQKGTSVRPYSLSGGMGRARPLHGKHPRLADVANGIAVYVSGTSVHLLRLSDGKDVPVRVTRNGRALAEIEPAGLFCASRTKVTFMPMSAVRRLLD